MVAIVMMTLVHLYGHNNNGVVGINSAAGTLQRSKDERLTTIPPLVQKTQDNVVLPGSK